MGAVAGTAAELGLRDLDLEIGYDSVEHALRRFYVPVLSRSVQYDRSVGYFRASALVAAARGLSRFIAGGGMMRLLIGAEVGEHERDAFVGAIEVPPEFAAKLAAELVPEDEFAQRRFEVLAWLAKEGRLVVKVAIAVDEHGVPVPASEAIPYFHEKVGVLRDHRKDGVAFQGSVNESATAWTANFESFSVYRSWDASAPYFDQWAKKFEQRWRGDVPGFRVYPLPEAVSLQLIKLVPEEAPPSRDVEEGGSDIEQSALARFLIAAPRLAGSDRLAEATAGVTPFPHQSKVVERLAGEYPRSWIVADEVGLGKTISAGLALRRLLLTGDVIRVLILAPANVCRQWQDELFEKFGLWVPRLERGRVHGAHPDDVHELPPGANPYMDYPVLLGSSHLARTAAHQKMILAAPRLDLLIVDEAHHARRHAADPDQYRPGRLLQLLDQVVATNRARALWLLTATPMQIHVIELIDLLRQVGLEGPMTNLERFEQFYAELAKSDSEHTSWDVLARGIGGASIPLDASDLAVLEAVGKDLGAVARERIMRFADSGMTPAETAKEIGPKGHPALRAWIRHRSPIGQHITRHTRQTLRRYRALGLFTEPLADREVAATPVVLSHLEQRLYDDLDGLLDRLMEAHGSKRGAGFVLTVYRRRLTSSWEAIRKTLRRRLERERLFLEDTLVDEADDEDLDTGDGGAIDDSTVLPLSPADLREIEAFIEDLENVPDSKFDQLTKDIGAARGNGRVVIVFTQFTDTLDYLRDRMHPSYRSQLATFSGDGGRQWLEGEGWVNVSKQDLVTALGMGRVSVVLATDAASEGLNLQAANFLINYDLPWNPMRVEQRIGRIDRIGQAAPRVTVHNYVIPGTVEESVYSALANRIDLFAGLIGRLQPMLGATEAAFRRVFQAPRSERDEVKRSEIEALLKRASELEKGGLDLEDDDPLPTPSLSQSPVTLDQLRRCLVEDLDVVVDQPGRPATFEPARVSRDPERWTALATYGHPALLPALEPIASAAIGESPLVIQAGQRRICAFRADRTPPEPVRTVVDLTGLGPSVAGGEAANLARAAASTADQEVIARERRAAGAQYQRWENQVRERFRDLVRRAITADTVLGALRDDEAIEPRLLWLQLVNDDTTGWSNADIFRQHLRIEVADLLAVSPTDQAIRNAESLKRERARTGSELISLIQEWLAVAQPNASQ